MILGFVIGFIAAIAMVMVIGGAAQKYAIKKAGTPPRSGLRKRSAGKCAVDSSAWHLRFTLASRKNTAQDGKPSNT
ncbi:hypothetical protein [Enterobacter phage N5822]|nr:hypothetical protein [Enterobacter phage N5822]